MGAYIVRRLLLIIPTLIGVMIINFTLTQFVPGGPVKQAIAQARGQGDVLASITGSAVETESNLSTGYEYVGLWFRDRR